jgi:hypothetical protein
VDIISVIDDDSFTSDTSTVPKSHKDLLNTIRRNMSNSFETIVDSHSLKNNVTQLVDPATPKHDTGTMSERVLCSDPVASQKLLLSPPTDTVTPKQDTGSTTHRVLRSDPHASKTLFLSLSPKNQAVTKQQSTDYLLCYEIV